MGVKKGSKIARYPWDEWFSKDNRKFTLRRGVHYECLTATMVFQVRNEGAKRDYTISIEAKAAEKDGTLKVSFRDREEWV